MQTKQRAFTLVELIIYLALAMVVALGLVYFLAAISESRLKATAISEVQNGEREVFSSLRRMISGSSAVNWSASVLDQTLGSLVVLDNLGQVRTIRLDNQGHLIVSSNGEELQLINSLLTVKRLQFSRLDDQTVGVKLELAYLAGNVTKQLEYTGAWQSAMSTAN